MKITRDNMGQVANDLASHLWNSSTLRHGMFTPPQFRELCRQALIAGFVEILGPDPKEVEDAIRFHEYEVELAHWEYLGRVGVAPRKPKGYDLWKQGDNPLGLE